MSRAVALLFIALAQGAFAQFPAKPIRLVVPFPAGESVDATARLVGQSWSAALGQPVVVDNRGLPGVLGASWHAVVAPAGTPRAVVGTLNLTLVETIARPEMRGALTAQGARPIGSSPEDLRTFMQDEARKWARVIKSSGARAD